MELTAVPTTCRVCESGCGLTATVREGRVTGLAPDPEHPVSRGYACRKGTGFLAIHDAPERVTSPLVRRDRALVPVGWDAALAEIGDRLRAIVDESGPDAVGFFLGNAMAYDLGSVLFATGLSRGLGTSRTWASVTLDNSEMFVVLEAVFGNAMRTFLADYAGSDQIVLIGTDPVSSQPSQGQSQPGAVRDLLAKGRAGQLVVLDPRTSATAKAASLHLQPRPGSDALVLAWLAREAAARCTDPWVGDLGALSRALAPFDRARASAASGLDEAALQDLLDRLLAAERPLVWGGLGVLLGPHGTVGWWLVLVLQALLGGLDRQGGWAIQRGGVDVARLWSWVGVPARDPKVTSRSGWPALLGTLPSATMAEELGPHGVRALIVVGGNPAVSLPDTRRAREALSKLDLLVSVDLFVNDTGTFAHAVLPAADWLERDGLQVHVANQRPVPHVQLDRAVVPPRGLARDDADILADLATAAGVPLFGNRVVDAVVRRLGHVGVARAATRLFGRVRWSDVASRRGALASPDPFGWFRARHRPRLAPPELVALLDGLAPPPQGFLLVTSVRPVPTMNSWMHQMPAAARYEAVARMHPDDLTALGSPSRVVLGGASDVEVDVIADGGIRRGVVVLPYGWGHLPGSVAAASPGVAANLLVGTERLEPGTGQPISNGLPIRIRPAG